VPVKVLRGHAVTDHAGVLDVAFHPTQPWVFTAGGDGEALLWCN
jgi:ribosome biogenesis protein ERB1